MDVYLQSAASFERQFNAVGCCSFACHLTGTVPVEVGIGYTEEGLLELERHVH